MADPAQPGQAASLGEQLAGIIERLPPDSLSLGELLDVFSDEGLLLLTILLTLVFLIPVSIPGVSTVFGAAILLVGVSRLFNRPLWLPARVKHKALPAARLRLQHALPRGEIRRIRRLALGDLEDGLHAGLGDQPRAAHQALDQSRAHASSVSRWRASSGFSSSLPSGGFGASAEGWGGCACT